MSSRVITDFALPVGTLTKFGDVAIKSAPTYSIESLARQVCRNRTMRRQKGRLAKVSVTLAGKSNVARGTNGTNGCI
jgi:hypothetical protein